ncbi:MAG TPA: hypothetical protein VGW38_23675, partial [Chloroflexota bacterium]|nr:hypothetical protein [Chloroflexota bacterium]
PNVANWQVRWMLLRGRWDYTPSGIMDQTHLRFYTRRTGEALCVGAGFRVLRCEVPTLVPAGAPEWLARLAQRVARSVLPELLAEGFIWELAPTAGQSVAHTPVAPTMGRLEEAPAVRLDDEGSAMRISR